MVTLKIKGTVIKQKGSYQAVADSLNYLILNFVFSEEWKECDHIVISTTNRANPDLGYNQIITGSSYTVPGAMITVPGFTLGLVGYDSEDNVKITSQRYEIAVKAAGFDSEKAEPSAAEKSAFDQAINDLNSAKSGVNYVHIRYADTVPTADDDMKESISDYMGVYCGTSKTAPTAYGEYKWHKIKGEQGERGLQGVQGIQGIQGVKGDKGDTGSQGIQGVQGEKGDKGDTGAKGDKGDKGDAFTYSDFTAEQLAALKGDKGDKGLQGEKGDKGDKGDKGEQGDPFTYADFTPAQLAALKGEKGERGEQGVQGVPGEKGDKGDKGDKGEQGEPGLKNLVDGTATGSLRTLGSIAEDSTYKLGEHSLAEGRETKASGWSSHAEGYRTKASEMLSHAEGHQTIASAQVAHAEGDVTQASGIASHAEGTGTIASGDSSHAEGLYAQATAMCQHVQGRYNILDETSDQSEYGTYAHIVGNGTSDSNRSNAHTLDWGGNAWFAGDVESATGGKMSEKANKTYVDTAIANAITTTLSTEV